MWFVMCIVITAAIYLVVAPVKRLLDDNLHLPAIHICRKKSGFLMFTILEHDKFLFTK
jgi:hypothetical protein